MSDPHEELRHQLAALEEQLRITSAQVELLMSEREAANQRERQEQIWRDAQRELEFESKFL